MAWSFICMYLEIPDLDAIREYINNSPDVRWIVKVAEHDRQYKWQTVSRLDEIQQPNYALWHQASGRINIPSGDPKTEDQEVEDSDAGWCQTLQYDGAQVPWFGANPAPMFLSFSAMGLPHEVARSDFSWAGDHFRQIGSPAASEAKRWWQGLRRFVAKSSNAISWPPGTNSRSKAYVFHHAQLAVQAGAKLDPNTKPPRAT